jgi:putative salt-induced outer membrane protein YdiY
MSDRRSHQGRRARCCLMAIVVTVGLARAVPLYAQKTDVITLANGDRITGEVKGLQRGQLELSTDDEGTIYFEWDKIATVESTRLFDIGTSDGRRFFGSLGSESPRMLAIVGPEGSVSLSTIEVTEITPIGKSFWKKLDGSLDIGFSYTHSSDIAQLNVNSNTLYRKPAFEARVNASGTLTRTGEDNERADRGILQMSYLRYRGQRWFVAGAASFENNESLGIRLRSQLGFAAGPRLVNTNRAQTFVGAGIAVNKELGLDTGSTENVEALFIFRTSYYSYDHPKTNLDIGFQYYPGLSDTGRHRLQLDSAVKREIWKDVYLAVNLFDTYDNRPPTTAVDTNDVGVVLSFGWSY